MAAACRDLVARSISTIAFADLFLEDVRAYRERNLAGSGLTPLFPLWRVPTGELAQRMVAEGLRARLTCVNPRKLPPSFAAREFDAALLAELARSVDPCGERGEFHTFCYAGPMFASPIPFTSGAIVERDGYVFADLLERDKLEVVAELT